MNTVTVLAALLRYILGVDMTPHDTQERSEYRYRCLLILCAKARFVTVDAEARYCLASTCIVMSLSSQVDSY